ncbi:MAG: endonuclease, partial [Clostridia bacterium]|nr:endonuclease [Clostridia bacterium]
MNHFLKILLVLLLAPAVLVAGVLTFLTVTEYRPADREEMVLCGAEESRPLAVGDTLSVMSWNIGYGALGDNADFFMEGGEMVMSADEDRVKENLAGITKEIRKVSPDVLLLQEVDSDSKRSYHIDETAMMEDLYEDDVSTEALYHSVVYV